MLRALTRRPEIPHGPHSSGVLAGGASAQEIEHTHIDEDHLEALLGLDTSKIGFYADVKQKIQELGAANLDLEAKTKELQAVFDSIGDGIAIFGPDRVVHYRNDMCPRVAPGEELIGATCADLFHPGSESSPNTCPVEAALRGERRSVSFTALEEESTRYYDASATPIDGPPGRPRRVLVLLRDVTERRLRELQLLQAEKMSSIGVLAAGVAHEINNPLTSVAGYAEALLRRRRDDPEFRDDDKLLVFWDYLAVIMREAHRCKGIIDSLLTFSRKSEGVMVAVDLNPLVDEVLDLLGFDTRSENVQIVRRLARDLRPVSGDPASLRQVILNLALNAVQAIEHRGRVSIVTRNAADRVAVEVRDNGCGIAPEHLEQIWSPFFTTKPVGRGLGLGLSVSYNIVRKHGGEVSVVSQKDQGSTFTVLLPVLKEP